MLPATTAAVAAAAAAVRLFDVYIAKMAGCFFESRLISDVMAELVVGLLLFVPYPGLDIRDTSPVSWLLSFHLLSGDLAPIDVQSGRGQRLLLLKSDASSFFGFAPHLLF